MQHSYKVEDIFPPLESGEGEQISTVIVKVVKTDSNSTSDSEHGISALQVNIKALYLFRNQHSRSERETVRIVIYVCHI